LVLSWDVDGGEVAAAIEPGQHDSIETIGLPPITRLAGDERRGDDLAVKAIAREHALKHKTGA